MKYNLKKVEIFDQKIIEVAHSEAHLFQFLSKDSKTISSPFKSHW